LLSTEHAIGFNGTTYLPKLKEGITTGKQLGLSPKKASVVVNNVKEGLSEWPRLQKAGVEEAKLLNLVQKAQGKAI